MKFACRKEPVPGDANAFDAFIAHPLDLFEAGSVVNVLTSMVGKVFGFKAARSLRLEGPRFALAGDLIGVQLHWRSLHLRSFRCDIIFCANNGLESMVP